MNIAIYWHYNTFDPEPGYSPGMMKAQLSTMRLVTTGSVPSSSGTAWVRQSSGPMAQS